MALLGNEQIGAGVALLIGVLFIGYGFFGLLWPQKIQKYFMANYDLKSPLKWHNPATWLRYKPNLFIFRILGILVIVLGVLLLLATWPKHR